MYRGLQVTPNLPDSFFNNTKVITDVAEPFIELTRVSSGPSFVYSPIRNCSGNIAAIQYCYSASREQFGDEQVVFDLSLLSRTFVPSLGGIRARPYKVVSIRSIPNGNKCRERSSGNWRCCDGVSLNAELMSSDDYYGITVTGSSVTPLAINAPNSQHTDFAEMFHVNIYIITSAITADRDSTINIIENGAPRVHGVAMLRFLIGRFV